MKRLWVLIVICLVLATGSLGGCNQSKTEEVNFEQLFTNPARYHNKNITIEGFYFHGFETIVLAESLEYSGFAASHLAPKGRMLWVEGGISWEAYNALNQQQMMGPVERYGKVRITGKFEYGGEYGHVGGYDRQITPADTILIARVEPGLERPEGEGFAIYLLEPDVPVSGMPAVSHLELAEEPVISAGDIISYSRETHEMKLTENALEKLRNLQVPVSGKAFAVCINHYPVYWGAFWTPFSSVSFDGVIILQPLSHEDSGVIKIELGYPSPDFYSGEDPRNEAELMKSLEEAGKLTGKPPAF